MAVTYYVHIGDHVIDQIEVKNTPEMVNLNTTVAEINSKISGGVVELNDEYNWIDGGLSKKQKTPDPDLVDEVEKLWATT